MTIFFGGLIIGLINCWQIALLTLATSPFIVAVGGISNIFLHRRFHILEHCMPLQMILLLSILMQPHFKLHYGRSATSDQIEEAVKIAHAHDFITSLEMGYEAQMHFLASFHGYAGFKLFLYSIKWTARSSCNSLKRRRREFWIRKRPP
ncbi:ABC transporter B family member 6-like [Zingiber officinale]|uniref:ABC transporter B family member 6-like n=1 Tax=Zingiber officinale TaxID=94328 RepID=UPI001C4DCEC5|nr:ABC transporter B family member 6-like [Zingiber officinale]